MGFHHGNPLGFRLNGDPVVHGGDVSHGSQGGVVNPIGFQHVSRIAGGAGFTIHSTAKNLPGFQNMRIFVKVA